MNIYRTRTNPFTGTKYTDVYKRAFTLYKLIKSKTKRRPFIRSAYFNKSKIFLGLFWEHLDQKSWKERTRRLKYFACGLDLIKNSKVEPSTKNNPNNNGELLYRFKGITSQGCPFYVQIKENKKSDQKFLISIFPD